MNPDRLAELEEERRFLLRSLRDLDAELDAGDVDVADYETLRDGYTKRAADVLRELDAGRATQPSRRTVSWSRRLGVAALVVAVAVGAGWLVARSSGQRQPGQEITGGAPADDVAVLLAEARALLGTDVVAAQERYQQVLEQRPDQVEAVTYSAWLLYVGSDGAGDELRAAAVDTARRQLLEATTLDPSYPDPHCFLGVIAASYADDVAAARSSFDTCLGLDPPAQVQALVERFAEQLEAPPTTG